MSSPETYKDASYGVSMELLSAMSSLHMYPDFKPGYGSGEETQVAFLSESEYNVEHSIAHIRAALRMASEIANIREALKTALMYTYVMPNSAIAKRNFLQVCKVFDIHSAYLGEIDPADPRTFMYIRDEDYTPDNAWNLWIAEVWWEMKREDTTMTWEDSVEEDEDD